MSQPAPATPTTLTDSEVRRLMKSAGLCVDDDLAEELPDIAALYAFEEAQARRLFLLCIRRDLLDLILGPNWREFQTKYGDEQEHRDQMFTHLLALAEMTRADIETLREQLASGAAGGGYSFGNMINRTPITTPCFLPNPNDRAYGGDPIRSTIADISDVIEPGDIEVIY